MAFISLNKLEKLKIKVYRTEARNGSPIETFEAMFNPESYMLSYENVYSKEQGINSSGKSARYSLSKPSDLSLKLILDGTGVSDYPVLTSRADLDVSRRVQKFMELTAYMDGNIHQPKFLKIEWGTLIFKCRLLSVDIAYTLFDKGGRPLRAELSTTFVGDLEESSLVLLDQEVHEQGSAFFERAGEGNAGAAFVLPGRTTSPEQPYGTLHG